MTAANARAERDRNIAKTLVDINEAVTGEDLDALVEALTSDYAQLRDVDPALAERYQAVLLKARLEKNDSLTYEEIQSVIDQVNEQVRREHLLAAGVITINEAVLTGSAEDLLDALQNEYVLLENVRDDHQLQNHYLTILKTQHDSKVEVHIKQ